MNVSLHVYKTLLCERCLNRAETAEVTALDDRSWLGVHGAAPWTAPRVSCLTRAFEAASNALNIWEFGGRSWDSQRFSVKEMHFKQISPKSVAALLLVA